MKMLVLAVVVASVGAYLAPPNTFLQVGTGLGMPEIVKSKYHTTDQILSDLSAMESKCNFMTKHEVSAAADSGQRSQVAYTLSDPSVDKSNKKRFMLTFGMHGREYISSETALYLAQFVCSNAATAPIGVNAALGQAGVAQAPAANVDVVRDEPAPVAPAAQLEQVPVEVYVPPTGSVVKAKAMQNVVAANSAAGALKKPPAPPAGFTQGALTPSTSMQGSLQPAAAQMQLAPTVLDGSESAAHKLVPKAVPQLKKKENENLFTKSPGVMTSTFKVESLPTLSLIQTGADSTADTKEANAKDALLDVQSLIGTSVESNGISQKMDPARLLRILQTTEITFIPVLNIEGRKKLEEGQSCTNQRKNGRGVDINRNFKDWFNPGNARDFEEDYQGPSAMSEWENRVVDTLARQFQPHAYLDIHSGDRGMGYVYGHSATELSPHNDLNREWTTAANSEAFGGQVWAGNLARMGSFPYESRGSSCDFMHTSHNVKIAGTWEIWKKQSIFGNIFFSLEGADSQDQPSLNDVMSTASNAAPTAADYQHITPTTSNGRDVGDRGDFLSLVQTAASKGVHSKLGLSEDELQALVQTEVARGSSMDEVQILLQEMGREECFSYFNPILPRDYDDTVAGFSHAILVGAEKLTELPSVSAAYAGK